MAKKKHKKDPGKEQKGPQTKYPQQARSSSDWCAQPKASGMLSMWLDRDTNGCLNFQRIGESMQRPLDLCQWEGPESLPAPGDEYQQGYKLVNDRLPKGRQRLHRAAEYRRGIDGRARNNAYGLQGKLPAKGKEYPGLGYKRVRDKPPKAQEHQPQPAEAQRHSDKHVGGEMSRIATLYLHIATILCAAVLYAATPVDVQKELHQRNLDVTPGSCMALARAAPPPPEYLDLFKRQSRALPDIATSDLGTTDWPNKPWLARRPRLTQVRAPSLDKCSNNTGVLRYKIYNGMLYAYGDSHTREWHWSRLLYRTYFEE
ncbi:hypothetical protein QJQ45_011744 [Haematococcus lacustris]|nr:hypothetical protein QJQ45_011744 [Haematococcus lacustris]